MFPLQDPGDSCPPPSPDGSESLTVSLLVWALQKLAIRGAGDRFSSKFCQQSLKVRASASKLVRNTQGQHKADSCRGLESPAGLVVCQKLVLLLLLCRCEVWILGSPRQTCLLSAGGHTYIHGNVFQGAQLIRIRIR